MLFCVSPRRRLNMALSNRLIKTLLHLSWLLAISCFLSSSAGAQTCVQPPSGLVSWWPGDVNFDDIADANGGGHAGRTTFTTGEVGQAFSFNGAENSFVTVGSNDMLPASNQLTIDAWIKPDFSVLNLWDTILTKRDDCGTQGISYNLGVNKGDPIDAVVGVIAFAMSTESDVIRATSGTTVVPNDGQFHHVAGTYDGSTMRVYLDGQLVGQASRTGPILGTTGAPVISQHGGECFQRAVAVIHEIEFYDRALSQAEILAIFIAGSAGKCKEPDTVVIDGCNTGVPDTSLPSGSTISDLIAACAEGVSNHGQFVSCVAHVTNDLKKAGTITGQQKGAIQSCAERADIPNITGR